MLSPNSTVPAMIKNSMHEIHWKVRDDADKREKQTNKLIEAPLGKIQETHKLTFWDDEGVRSRGLA